MFAANNVNLIKYYNINKIKCYTCSTASDRFKRWPFVLFKKKVFNWNVLSKTRGLSTLANQAQRCLTKLHPPAHFFKLQKGNFYAGSSKLRQCDPNVTLFTFEQKQTSSSSASYLCTQDAVTVEYYYRSCTIMKKNPVFPSYFILFIIYFYIVYCLL